MITRALNPIATRFLWKECRALRGLWIAVLILGLFVQWIAGVVLPGHIDFATIFFSIALAAALALSGWITCGFDTPGGRDFPVSLALFGVPILEALAWGTLFSLLVKRPLVAAILTLIVGTVAVQLAASAMSTQSTPLADPGNYIKALPLRLVIVVLVFVGATVAARRWFSFLPATSSKPGAVAIHDDAEPLMAELLRSAICRLVDRRGGQIIHLLWQTWRQSWHLLLAMPVLALGLCGATFLIAATANLLRSNDIDHNLFVPFAFAFSFAALYASAVFAVDQGGAKYRFLAEHAARPRLVWLSRLAVWILPMLIAMLLVILFFLAFGRHQLNNWLREIRAINQYNSHWQLLYLGFDMSAARRTTLGFSYAAWGLFAGFALGQACSLFFRQPIISAFAAAATAVPCLLWGFLIWIWELSPAMFLLPIMLGLLAATWLRVPDWIIDRNRISSWIKVAAALVFPLLFMAWYLPFARLAPVAEMSSISLARIARSQGVSFPPSEYEKATVDIPAVVAHWAKEYEADRTPAERETAERLIRLSEQIETPERPTASDEKPELTKADWMAYNRELTAMNAELIDEAAKLSRKSYRFPPFVQTGPRGEKIGVTRLDALADLLSHAGDIATDDDQLDAALEYYLSALTLWERLSVGQPSDFLPSEWSRERHQQKLVNWANAPGQTRERIAAALDALDSIYPDVKIPRSAEDLNDYLTHLSPPTTLMADYVLLRDIILGKEDPRVLTPDTGPIEYVTLLVSQLPFERERALRLLDRMTFDQAIQYDNIVRLVNQQVLQASASEVTVEQGEAVMRSFGKSLQRRFLEAYSYGIEDEYLDYSRYEPLRSTWLLRMELLRAMPFVRWLEYNIDRQISGWGLRQQLALVAYRHDHGQYPESLTELVPDYLPFVPIDPYSGQPFEYRPRGLRLELHERQKIAPHTPLLWSVGWRNARLVVGAAYDADDIDANPDLESDVVRRDVYKFQLDPTLWDGGAQLIFPLPK